MNHCYDIVLYFDFKIEPNKLCIVFTKNFQIMISYRMFHIEQCFQRFARFCQNHGSTIQICFILATNWQRMTFSVKDPLVKRQHRVIGEGQIEVLECGRQEYGILEVDLFGGNLVDIHNARVSATVCFAMPFKCLCQLPCILTIPRVVGQSP